ncbi:phosphoenolpyruvate carboxylase-like isoform X3 [Gastrolobium bilobum]|uniref:phosphoenolpyruvate carboxylase-like isoform X3 n=1 Tax=Gastrolobium bilobum TaxID=150636 RepID=UPI002AB0CD88|nr:phosphoenolpyruvate carboxylase-like isoform X3 [Gastrolobium bilobum]
MATRNVEKMASIDAQLRLLAPSKVSDDDKLVEYDALLLDRFLDILQDLHGADIRETTVMSCLLSTKGSITLRSWRSLGTC